jgi:hypothetical protein
MERLTAGRGKMEPCDPCRVERENKHAELYDPE